MSALRSLGERGLTLIELIVFIAIVSVALAGVLAVFNGTVWHSADPLIRKQALAVAEAMLDEVLSKEYQNDTAGDNATTPALGCTPGTVPSCRANTQGDRQNYNDVDDYDQWDQTGVVDLLGNAVAGLGAYRVQIGVAAPADFDGVVGKLVTVTVTNGGEAITLTGFRANF